MLPIELVKYKYKSLFKDSVEPLRCIPSFPICFLVSRDFCHINLILLSSSQSVATMLLMTLEVNISFMVDLRLLTSSIVFSAIIFGN